MSTGVTNLSTNNINLNNLNNNLDEIILNNNNVVDEINKNINLFDLTDQESELLKSKNIQDLETVKKYKKSNLDIVRILSAICPQRFRLSLVFNNLNNYSEKAETLLLKVLNLKRYEERIKQINNLSEVTIGELFNEACALFDEEQNDKYIRKSPEAYFIGIVDNVLNS